MLECPHCSPNENNDKETLEYLANIYCGRCGHPYYCSCSRNSLEDNEPKDPNTDDDKYEEYLKNSYDEYLRSEEKIKKIQKMKEDLKELRKEPTQEIKILNDILLLLNNLPHETRATIMNVAMKISELEESEKVLVDKINSNLKDLSGQTKNNLIESVLTFYGIEKFKDPNSKYDLPDF